LSPSGDFTSAIDAVFISHFHLDHVGALPYFTEVSLYIVTAVVSLAWMLLLKISLCVAVPSFSACKANSIVRVVWCLATITTATTAAAAAAAAAACLQVCGYRGPVFMTYPTRAIAPLMLEDYYK
jgi:Cft2 family RNA processing exonuclease